jgi:hypothetical protein
MKKIESNIEVIRSRSSLPRLKKGLENGSVVLGFIGGSITAGGNRWQETVIAWFVDKYPGVRFFIENAAIGATGSDLAVFRAHRDLINRNCDIVFIEYAVNDWHESKEKRMRTREGLIRKLLTEERDIVLVYTYSQDMYDDMINGKIPGSIMEFEELAEHYRISSVWMGLHTLREVMKGLIRWEEWLPDGLHTDHRGSLSYAQSVIAFLNATLDQDNKNNGVLAGNKLPIPLNKNNWEFTHLLPFAEIKLEGPWTIRRWESMQYADQVIDTAAIGAAMSFSFEGRGLSLGFDFGKTSSEFRYSLDNGDWVDVVRERPDWLGDSGWFRIQNIADDLEKGIHEFKLITTHGNRLNCKGTNFRLVFVGIIN